MGAPRPVEERFWEKVNKTSPDGCWLWTGCLSTAGYGKFMAASFTQVAAHRWAYEQAFGPIPGGLQIDHLCRVRNCCNPAHLEAVTQHENILRAAAAKTHCLHGHAYTASNTIREGLNGPRRCKTCRRPQKAVA